MAKRILCVVLFWSILCVVLFWSLTSPTRTPLDEWSARRRDLYLTTHNTHNRQTSMPPVGFEPTISAGERQQTYALDRTATGTGPWLLIPDSNFFYSRTQASVSQCKKCLNIRGDYVGVWCVPSATHTTCIFGINFSTSVFVTLLFETPSLFQNSAHWRAVWIRKWMAFTAAVTKNAGETSFLCTGKRQSKHSLRQGLSWSVQHLPDPEDRLCFVELPPNIFPWS